MKPTFVIAAVAATILAGQAQAQSMTCADYPAVDVSKATEAAMMQ